MEKMFMKRLLVILAAAALLLVMLGGQALAAVYSPSAAIYVNGQYLRTDTQPLLADGATYVPLRTVSSALGAEVSWQNGEAAILLGDKTIILKADSQSAVVNGQNMRLDSAPRMQDGRIMVPLRFISEQLGAQVDYYNRMIYIEPAAGSRLPDIPKLYVKNGGKAAAGAAAIYLAWDNDLWQIDKRSLEFTELEPRAFKSHNAGATPATIYSALNVLGDKLYFSANYSLEHEEGALVCYDPASGSTNMNYSGLYNCQLYHGYLYYNTSPTGCGELYRIPLNNGWPAAGEAAWPFDNEKVADEVSSFWFVGDKLFYDSYGIKVFQANLDGSSMEKLNMPQNAGNIVAYDAGWYYCLDGSDNSVLYRFRAGDIDKQRVLGLADYGIAGDIAQVEVLGNGVYFATKTERQSEGTLTAESGPIYCLNLSGGLETLTQGKTPYFYVFEDILLYYDVTSVGEYGWRADRIIPQNVTLYKKRYGIM